MEGSSELSWNCAPPGGAGAKMKTKSVSGWPTGTEIESRSPPWFGQEELADVPRRADAPVFAVPEAEMRGVCCAAANPLSKKVPRKTSNKVCLSKSRL